MSSFSANTDQPTLSLESVKLNFLNWRRNPHGPNRIPESLWNEVIHLLSHQFTAIAAIFTETTNKCTR